MDKLTNSLKIILHDWSYLPSGNHASFISLLYGFPECLVPVPHTSNRTSTMNQDAHDLPYWMIDNSILSDKRKNMSLSL